MSRDRPRREHAHPRRGRRLAAGLAGAAALLCGLLATPAATAAEPSAVGSGASPAVETGRAEAAGPRTAGLARLPDAVAAAQRRIPINRIRPPSRRSGSWIAKVLVATIARRRPNGKRRLGRLKTQTKFNRQPQRLMVLGARTDPAGREWLKVRLPTRPNDAAGWILRDRVLLSRTRDWIEVNVRKRTVSLYSKGRRKRKTRAVVGKRKTPTPRGLFAVYETVKQPNPNAFLGSWALHLTAHSDVLFNFGGGEGRVALHGRGGASFADPLGSASSHGCIRVNNGFVEWVARRVITGTPVQIR